MTTLALEAAALGGRLGALVQEDADAYALVNAAYKLPGDGAAGAREEAIQAALVKAAEVPLETARACRDVALLAATCATRGNTNTVSDSGVAALLVEAACRGAAYNVRINVASMTDPSLGAAFLSEAAALVAATQAAAQEATARVDEAIG
jgi:formiminotetrahydrofolate cyclodeaminase